jgi:hypothetical protein
MPTTTLLSKVKTDFFAILVPGFFIFGVIVSFFLAFTHKDTNISILERIKPFFKILKDYWPLVIVLIVIGYLLGNLIRAIRVTTADKFSKIIFSRLAISEEKKLFYKNSFPYPDILNKIRQDLIDSKLIASITLPNGNCLYSAWNFWKITIGLEFPDMFNYIQNLESRVRLFAGMFWAGLLGIIGSLVIFGGCIFNNVIKVVWLDYNIYLFFTSAVLFFMFGMNLRRVRREEARSVFMGYLALQKKMKEKETTWMEK